MIYRINMGALDRALRTVIGLGLLYVTILGDYLPDNAYMKMLLGLFGLLNVGSALFGFCPVYNLASLSTVKKSDN